MQQNIDFQLYVWTVILVEENENPNRTNRNRVNLPCSNNLVHLVSNDWVVSKEKLQT